VIADAARGVKHVQQEAEHDADIEEVNDGKSIYVGEEDS
jgi:hypothetical protein